MLKYRCYVCSSTFEITTTRYRCDCGGLFVLETGSSVFEVDRSDWSLWRYRSLLPKLTKESSSPPISMGEGMTPLVKDLDGCILKLDFLNPTLSYKDRGSVVLMALAKALGVKEVAIDSSGNAGVSVAAYAKRASIGAHVFVPESTSSKKVKQLQLFDAEIHQGGDRSFAALAIAEFLEHNRDIFYASHVYNPFFIHGVKTVVFEIFEQLQGRLPAEIVVPVGNGTLVLGVHEAIEDLKRASVIQVGPKIIAVQARACAPVFEAFQQVPTSLYRPPSETVAEGIAITSPPRASEIIAAVSESNGSVIAVSETEILDAQRRLFEQGIDVEPTAAATYAGYLMLRKSSCIESECAVVLTGAGLKSR